MDGRLEMAEGLVARMQDRYYARLGGRDERSEILKVSMEVLKD